MRGVILTLLPFFVYGNYLIKINTGAQKDFSILLKVDIVPIEYFDSDLLALSRDQGLSFLQRQGINFEIVDFQPMDKNYYLVWTTDNTDLNAISKVARILLRRDNLLLIRLFDESGLITLNKLKIELKHISFDPLVITEGESRFEGIEKDTLIQEMANLVSLDTILSVVRRLQNFRTRYSSTDSALACAQWLRSRFINYGFDSVYVETFSTTYAPNIISVKKGMVYPSRIYVVGCGHYDCTSQTPTTFAPGADDNGSGVTMVLESARILRRYRFEYTIRLIGFCGEEQGLLGSAYYAQRARSRGDSIRGAINYDMFAYTTPNRDTLTIINDTTYRNNLWLANYCAACADTYTNLKKKVWTGRRAQSDHASFSRYGYPAIQGRENLNVSNPYYHTTGDSIGGGFNAYTMCFEGIRAAVATIASLAVPYRTRIDEAHKFKNRDRELKICPSIVSSRTFSLNYYVQRSGTIKFIISNPSGQIVRTWSKKVSGGQFYKWRITHHLNPGVYFVLLQSEDKFLTGKLIVE